MLQEVDKVYKAIPSDRQIIGLFSETSKKIRDIYYSPEHKGVVSKPDGSPQTSADRIASETIVEYLKKNTPFPVLSEELDDGSSLNAKIFWTLDPLDGTRDFLEQTGEFAIMLALVKDTTPIFGTVYHPLTGMCYMAKKGQGAFLVDDDGSSLRLHVSNTAAINEARMTVSRHHKKGTDLEVAKRLGVKELIQRGSFGLKAGLIAGGNAEIFLNSSGGTSVWDSAPNIIIVTEAGGQITDLNGKELSVDPAKTSNENGIVATNGQNHLQTAAKIRQIVDQVRAS